MFVWVSPMDVESNCNVSWASHFCCRSSDADRLDDHRDAGDDRSPISERNVQGTQDVWQRHVVCGEEVFWNLARCLHQCSVPHCPGSLVLWTLSSIQCAWLVVISAQIHVPVMCLTVAATIIAFVIIFVFGQGWAGVSAPAPPTLLSWLRLMTTGWQKASEHLVVA